MQYDLTTIENEFLAKLAAVNSATKTTEMLVLAKTATELSNYGSGGANPTQALLTLLLGGDITSELLTDYLGGNDFVINGVFYDAVPTPTLYFNEVINTQTAFAAVMASSTAFAAVMASSTAFAAVMASSTAFAAVVESSTAMAAIIASPTAATLSEQTLQSYRTSVLTALSDTAKFTKARVSNVCQNLLTATVGAGTNSVYVPISTSNGHFLTMHSLLNPTTTFTSTASVVTTGITLRGTKVTSSYGKGYSSIHMSFDVYTVI